MGSAVPTSKRDFRRLATKIPSISREVLIEVLSSIRATPGFYASRRRTVPFFRRKMKNRANHHRLSLTLSATKQTNLDHWELSKLYPSLRFFKVNVIFRMRIGLGSRYS